VQAVTKQLFRKLWSDDQGALIAMEFLFVAVITVIGIITGLVAVRNAINTELTELANAILALSPGYAFSGQSGCCAYTDGSQAIVIPTQLPFPTCSPPFFPVVIAPVPCQ